MKKWMRKLKASFAALRVEARTSRFKKLTLAAVVVICALACAALGVLLIFSILMGMALAPFLIAAFIVLYGLAHLLFRWKPDLARRFERRFRNAGKSVSDPRPAALPDESPKAGAPA